QKAPEHRFSSASEVASALREARERPSIAAYGIENDAPGHVSSFDLPPRRSPLPDRGDFEEDAPPRRSNALLLSLLIVFLAAATAAGYYLFGRPLPSLESTIPVGDYTKMTDAQANAAIVNAGLRVHFTRSASDTVPMNYVVSQNPMPGTSVAKNSLVELVVSNGLPTVGLPSVLGYNYVSAERTLQEWPSGKFVVSIVRKNDASPKDTVIDQFPKATSMVRQGSKITLTVSQGPAPIVVPNFVGLSAPAAQSLAGRLGIKLDTSQTVQGLPANTIASQDLSEGTKVDSNTVVHAVVNSGMPVVAAPNAPLVTLPSVVGSDYATAMSTLGAAGFTVDVTFAQQSTNNGTIVAQNPAPNSQVPQSATVSVTLSVSGEVPDTEGMMPDAAVRKLESFGYRVGKTQVTASVGAGGKVVGTDPQVGTNLSPGSAVTLIVNGASP
ncbi:MAG TPA: PASTA domain-containing protein, partial [Verrucomicrobiae bacterium]|nr:PASTA domain-containing protein [Verrucomicrobiae bacterium]